MKRYRVLMVLTALLAMAGAVCAQAPAYELPYPLQDVEGRVEVNGPSWPTKAWQESCAAWARLQVMCASGQKAGCCETGCAKGAGCALGVAQAVVAGHVKGCACAKACACCESCKEKKDTQRVQVMPLPLTQGMIGALMGGGYGAALPQPAPMMPPTCLPPAHGTGIVQIVPVAGGRVIELGGVQAQGGMKIMIVQMAHQTKPAHFVTPDLEAHCERMHHRGDTVVLEGNVLLLCKKHAQPIRIEAQRVLVNMKDGSFTVDSNVQPMTTTFGVHRTSALVPSQSNMTCPMACPFTCPVQGMLPITTEILHNLLPTPTSRPR